MRHSANIPDNVERALYVHDMAMSREPRDACLNRELIEEFGSEGFKQLVEKRR